MPKVVIATAALIGLANGIAQAAENTTNTYEFQNVYGGQVKCVVTRREGIEERQIVTVYRSSSEYDRTPTQQAWANSGCAAVVKSRTRVLSRDEALRRQSEVGKPVRYYGPGGLREEIVELMCRDPKNATTDECIRWAAR